MTNRDDDRAAADVVGVMLGGASLGDGLAQLRGRVPDAVHAGDALYRVAVGVRRAVEMRLGPRPTSWWTHLLDGCGIVGLDGPGRLALLDRLHLDAMVIDDPAPWPEDRRPGVATML